VPNQISYFGWNKGWLMFILFLLALSAKWLFAGFGIGNLVFGLIYDYNDQNYQQSW
jgi:hypothetical protein